MTIDTNGRAGRGRRVHSWRAQRLRPEPAWHIVVDTNGSLMVSLHEVDVDARDLFIAVNGSLEQRYEDLSAEIS